MAITSAEQARRAGAIAKMTCDPANDGCGQKPGQVCVSTTGSGKTVTPHTIRKHDYDVWLSRQPEVDGLNAQLGGCGSQLASMTDATNTLTRQRDEARSNAATLAEQLQTARAGAALVPALQQQVAELTARLAVLEHPAPTGPTDLPGWKLDLVEDFATLNTKVWTPWAGLHMGGHAEAAIAANVTVLEQAVRADPGDAAKQVTADGVLRMVAKKETAKATDGSTQAYSSGAMYSQGKYTLPRYHRIEVRCAIPWGQGLWAAPLWERPNDQSDGEIDLVEAIGREANVMHYTVHTGGYGANHKQSGGSETIPSPAGWHTWVLEKTKNLIVMWRDGKEVKRMTNTDPAWNDAALEADKRWAIWSNLQLGGSWAGAPDATTPLPAEMLIDYIHTWVPAA